MRSLTLSMVYKKQCFSQHVCLPYIKKTSEKKGSTVSHVKSALVKLHRHQIRRGAIIKPVGSVLLLVSNVKLNVAEACYTSLDLKNVPHNIVSSPPRGDLFRPTKHRRHALPLPPSDEYFVCEGNVNYSFDVQLKGKLFKCKPLKGNRK